jgi:RNA polymerase sigma factor (sigma-70 family)
MVTIEDDSTWNRFRQGDRAAFSQLLQQYYQPLFNYGTKLTNDTEFVKDCIQDLFLELWKNHRTLGPAECVRAYLLKSIRRKLYRQLYRDSWRTRTTVLDEDYHFELTFSVETRLIQEQEQAQLSATMARLLNELPRRQKEILYLRFYQELDVPQIVAIMDISTQSTYNLLHKALQRMKQQLQRERTGGVISLTVLLAKLIQSGTLITNQL